MDFLQDALQEWSAVDLVAVARFIEEHPDDDVDKYSLTVVEDWAACDPWAAKAWVDQQIRNERNSPESDMESSWLIGYVQGDRVSGIQYAVDNQDKEKVQSALSLIMSGLFFDSAADVRAFVDRFSGKAKIAALEGAGYIVSDREDPTEFKAAQRTPEFVAKWLMEVALTIGQKRSIQSLEVGAPGMRLDY